MLLNTYKFNTNNAPYYHIKDDKLSFKQKINPKEIKLASKEALAVFNVAMTALNIALINILCIGS